MTSCQRSARVRSPVCAVLAQVLEPADRAVEVAVLERQVGQGRLRRRSSARGPCRPPWSAAPWRASSKTFAASCGGRSGCRAGPSRTGRPCCSGPSSGRRRSGATAAARLSLVERELGVEQVAGRRPPSSARGSWRSSAATASKSCCSRSSRASWTSGAEFSRPVGDVGQELAGLLGPLQRRRPAAGPASGRCRRCRGRRPGTRPGPGRPRRPLPSLASSAASRPASSSLSGYLARASSRSLRASSFLPCSRGSGRRGARPAAPPLPCGRSASIRFRASARAGRAGRRSGPAGAGRPAWRAWPGGDGLVVLGPAPA